MAGYCHGANAPYGCGHHAEHVEAAKKGWANRRKHQRGATFEGSEDQYYASGFLGEQISYAHTHPEHKGRVVFKSKGKWYELPARTFASYVSGGRKLEREEQKRAEARKRDEAKGAKAKQRTARQELQYRLQAERYADRAGGADEFRAELVKQLSKHGVRATGKHDRGEVALLPSSVRRSKGKYTIDYAREAAQELSESYGAGITFDTPDDLVQYFEKDAYRRQESAYRRRRLRDEIAALRTPRKSRKAS